MSYNQQGYGGTGGTGGTGYPGNQGMGIHPHAPQGMQSTGYGTSGMTPGTQPGYGTSGMMPDTQPGYGTSGMTPGTQLGYGTTGMMPGTQPGYGTTGMNETYPHQQMGGSNYVLPPQTTPSSGYGTGAMGGVGGMGGMGGMGAAQGTGMGGMNTMGGTMSNHVVGAQYALPTVSSFAVSKKKMSLSGGDWTITDQTGLTVFKVAGKIATMRDRRVLRNASGTDILTMKKKLVTMHDSWQICSSDNDHVIATVKKSALVQFRTAMDVMLASSPTGSHTPDYQIKGDFFERNLTIFRGAEQAAIVTRQITFTSAIMDKDTFGVTVFPGVDFALILALVVIMDEVYLHDNDD